MQSPSDTELMQNVRDGDLEAFRLIVLRHQGFAWNVAYNFTGDAFDAEDITQEAFLRVFEAAARYKPSASFRTYLFRILNRLCIDHNRKKRPVPTEHVDPGADPALSPEQRILHNEKNATVRKAIEALPPRQRMAVILRYYEGMDYKAVSATLGTSEKAVERLLARARETLALKLEPFFDPE